MEIINQVDLSRPIIKRIGDDIVLSEYDAGNHKFVNIAVDRTTKTLTEIYFKLSDYLIENNLTIFNQFLFGTEEHESKNRDEAEKYFNSLNWPVTIIEQESLNGSNEWGTIISANTIDNIKPIFEEETIIGNYFNDEFAGYFYFGGLMPNSSGKSKVLQSKKSFKMLDASLKKVGMDIGNVTRTWFYLKDLLKWYDDFNSVRNDYYTASGAFEKLIPASTGIGAGNLGGSSLLFGGYALKKNTNSLNMKSVESPFQCPASNYKSAFSRAVEINHPYYRHLIISGTASITPEGETANVGSISKQIELTMKVVRSILHSREMEWENVTRGIVYFKNKTDIKSFEYYCSENNLPLLPLSMIQADICREELLFEIEVDAITVNKNN